ncbi:hypothetical protein [Brevibacterium spongiae]|uniref:Uncharacterized protein n=1 Tax=Brevibacterium spongiae TaxID=2909672 RepID=A0ABY5SSP5_9MICO|nr:hypothetical protein [Brevibacterium spongiae]UVI36084.1 hypothetical protein L1F31_18550 [Brevibacterium spongiae]
MAVDSTASATFVSDIRAWTGDSPFSTALPVSAEDAALFVDGASDSCTVAADVVFGAGTVASDVSVVFDALLDSAVPAFAVLALAVVDFTVPGLAGVDFALLFDSVPVVFAEEADFAAVDFAGVDFAEDASEEEADADLLEPVVVPADRVPPDDFEVLLEVTVFPAAVFPVPCFDAADAVPVVFLAVLREVDDFAVDVFAEPALVDFVEPSDFNVVPLFVPVSAFVEPPAFVAVAAFGLRRREDCMEAAGSVRAVREVFASPSRAASSAFPPEKKTSTGRSLEFASGISAPSPRPRPLFLRSATTYSSIRDFFSGFSVRECTARMWVI